mgnify:CR=1 FL=1|tara:strand:- start:933 stop:1463 length:531 start_codon:yes stop_codon:yes gene_type:complete
MNKLLIVIAIILIINVLYDNNLVNYYNQYKKYIKISLIIIVFWFLYSSKDGDNEFANKILESMNKVDSVPITHKNISNIITKFANNSNTTSNSNNKKTIATKRNVPESVKKYVAGNIQKWKCRSCNCILDSAYEVDHIMPLHMGGSNDINNLRALCRNCHGKKTVKDRINLSGFSV